MNPTMAVYELGFALNEVILFLDTHPDDAAALEYYRQLKCQYEKAVAEYSRTCSPLTANQVDADDFWLWAKTPWPWEGGCLCGTMKNDCNTR